MIWKRGNKSMVGVDIGSSSVKAVELRGKGGDFQLLSLGYEGLQPDSVVDGQIMELNAVSTAIGNIFNEHKIKTTKVAAGVNGHSVIVKNIVLPQMTADELQESFAWHAEEHIPFDISDVNRDYHVTGSTPDAIHVLLAACKRDKISNLKQTMDFFRATVEDGESAVQKILISGGGSKLNGLVDFLARQFEIPVEVFNPFRKIRIDSRGFDPEYMREIVPEMAIAVGLALRGVDAR